MEIAIIGKNGMYIDRLTRGQKSAITRAVRKAGFDTAWETGMSIMVEGAYYGEAVEAINALGYETDEDETE